MDDNRDKDAAKASAGRVILPVAAAAVALGCAVAVYFGNGEETKVPQTEAAAEEALAVSDPKEDADDAMADQGEDADGASVTIRKGESLVIPVSEITEEVSFYPIRVDGEDMEVLAVRASDGTVRTAFNTCQSCYTSGAGFYSFQDGELICNNCGFRFSPDQVEVASGGCNPWPIFEEDKTVTDESISISYDYLSGSKDIFANWKTALE